MILSVAIRRRTEVSRANDPVAGSVILARRLNPGIETLAREMSEDELRAIALPQFLMPPETDPSLLQCCETIYLNGFSDDCSGDVDCPTGHFYRVARWIVETDSHGFSYLTAFIKESQAVEYFEACDREYAAWSDEGDED